MSLDIIGHGKSAIMLAAMDTLYAQTDGDTPDIVDGEHIADIKSSVPSLTNSYYHAYDIEAMWKSKIDYSTRKASPKHHNKACMKSNKKVRRKMTNTSRKNNR